MYFIKPLLILGVILVSTSCSDNSNQTQKLNSKITESIDESNKSRSENYKKTSYDLMINQLNKWESIRKDKKRVKEILTNTGNHFKLPDSMFGDSTEYYFHAVVDDKNDTIDQNDKLAFYLSKHENLDSNPHYISLDTASLPKGIYTKLPTTYNNHHKIDSTIASNRINYWKDSIKRNNWINSCFNIPDSSLIFKHFIMDPIDVSFGKGNEHEFFLSIRFDTTLLIADIIVLDHPDSANKIAKYGEDGDNIDLLEDVVHSVPPFK